MSNSNIKGLTVIYDPASDTSHISFCYDENADIDHFILEYFDEIERKWVPYDHKYGIIERRGGIVPKDSR